MVLRVKSWGAGFSRTCLYGKEWATNRWGGLVQTERRWRTADALGRVLTRDRSGLGSPFPGCCILGAEES